MRFTFTLATRAGCRCIGSIAKAENPDETDKEKTVLGQTVNPVKSPVRKLYTHCAVSRVQTPATTYIGIDLIQS